MSPGDECALREMINNPGTVSPWVAKAAASAALTEIERLRAVQRLVIGELRPGDDEPGSAWADFSAAQVRQIENTK